MPDIAPAAGALVLTLTAPLVEIDQYLSPDADITDGLWTNQVGGSELFSAIDEAVPDDVDYIKSSNNPSEDACEVRLSDPFELPALPFQVQYRYGKMGGASIDLTVALKQGASEIAAWLHQDIPISPVTALQDLTSEQFTTITDFDDLRFEFMASLSSGADARITEDGDVRITEDGNRRILE